MPDHGSKPTRLKVGEFIIDRDDERLLGPGGPVKLGNKAFQLLNLLVERHGMLVTKDAIFSTVWDGTFVSESALTSTVKELRRALGDGSRQSSYIESVYGRGYRLIAEVAEAEARPSASPARPARPSQGSSLAGLSDAPPVIIVSEFNDAAVRQAMPYLGAGLREEILSSLAQFREIQLVANSHFDERNPQIEALDRSYHLTATLLPDRGAAKFIVRTKRLSDGRVLWAENMSLADTGAAAGVDRIVRRIAGSLLPAVDQDLIVGVGQQDDNLFDRYLKAKQVIRSGKGFDSVKAAAEQLEAIVAERPDFALAYGPLVLLYNTDYFFTAPGISKGELRARAMELAKAGLGADPNHAHNQSVMGWCYLHARQYERAEDCFEKTLARNPYNYERLNELGTAMTMLGHFDRAHELIALCHEMAPWDQDFNLEDEGRLHLLEGNFEAASATFQSIGRPGFWSALYRAMSDHALGHDDARETFARWREHVAGIWQRPDPLDGPTLVSWVAETHAFRGEPAERFFSLLESLAA